VDRPGAGDFRVHLAVTAIDGSSISALFQLK